MAGGDVIRAGGPPLAVAEGPDAAFLRSRLDGQWCFAVDDASWVLVDK